MNLDKVFKDDNYIQNVKSYKLPNYDKIAKDFNISILVIRTAMLDNYRYSFYGEHVENLGIETFLNKNLHNILNDKERDAKVQSKFENFVKKLNPSTNAMLIFCNFWFELNITYWELAK